MVVTNLQITERDDVVNGVEGLAHSWTKGKTRNKCHHSEEADEVGDEEVHSMIRASSFP